MNGLAKDIVLLIAAGGLLFSLMFIFLGRYLWIEGREMRGAGVTVTATVLKKLRHPEDRSWGGLENYYVRCSFNDAVGKAHEVELKVQSKLWRQTREGGTLWLTYMNGQPETARVGPRLGWQIRGIVGTIIMAFGIVALLVIPFAAFREWINIGS